jgi:glutathione S-transferase
MTQPLTLHWSPRSPYVRKVMVCAHELGLVDKIRTVRSVAAMLKPNAALMEDNPLSKIPTLVLEDGSALARPSGRPCAGTPWPTASSTP